MTIPQDFQRQYAAVIVDLDDINRVSRALHVAQFLQSHLDYVCMTTATQHEVRIHQETLQCCKHLKLLMALSTSFSPSSWVMMMQYQSP